MNAKLLEKIEELTLHLIDQNNRINQQDEELKKMKNELNALKNKAQDQH